MDNTLVVNLYGAPGAGKSTGAAYIFSMLKMRGINVELVTEFAKDKTWENSFDVLKNQAYVFGEQLSRVSRLDGKVDVIITDSPLLLSIVYNRSENKDTFNNYVMDVNNKYNNLNYFLSREKEYSQVGRSQTEAESNALASDIIDMLNSNGIPYKEMPGNCHTYDIIVDNVLSLIGNTEKEYCNICGKEFDFWDIQEDASVVANLGYGSKYDGEFVDIHICCDCLDKLIDKCKIMPLK